nr:MAG TPA: hypothetical protein [Caudoviricetes sp.]
MTQLNKIFHKKFSENYLQEFYCVLFKNHQLII